MSSTTDGEPCFSSSSAPSTSTGRAASSTAPRMKEPVTTTSPTSVLASCVAWAQAWPETPSANVAATADALQKNLLLVMGFLPSAPSSGHDGGGRLSEANEGVKARPRASGMSAFDQQRFSKAAPAQHLPP